MEDSKSSVDAQSPAGGASSEGGVGPLLKNPAVVGGAGALLGLLLGVLVGRASVGITGDDQPLVRAEGHLAQRPENRSAVDEAPAPTAEYRLHLGRKLPQGSKGFTRGRIAKRPVAVLRGERATLRFDIAPSGSSYALTSIAVLDGAKAGKLEVELDGKPLGTSSLNEGWGIYANSLPAGSLSAGTHELTFRHESPGGGSVGVESIAIAPVAEEVELDMGVGASGAMIEGFSGPSRDAVWSNGLRSSLGILLSRAEGNYRLKVRGSAISKLAPLTVSARVNGRDLGTGLFQKKLSTAEWAIPANSLQAGVNRIEFSYPQTATPSEYNPNSRDNRPLALRFQQVTVQPNQ